MKTAQEIQHQQDPTSASCFTTWATGVCRDRKDAAAAPGAVSAHQARPQLSHRCENLSRLSLAESQHMSYVLVARYPCEAQDNMTMPLMPAAGAPGKDSLAEFHEFLYEFPHLDSLLKATHEHHTQDRPRIPLSQSPHENLGMNGFHALRLCETWILRVRHQDSEKFWDFGQVSSACGDGAKLSVKSDGKSGLRFRVKLHPPRPLALDLPRNRPDQYGDTFDIRDGFLLCKQTIIFKLLPTDKKRSNKW